MASYQKTRTVYYRRAAEKGDKGDTGDPGEKGERGALLRGPFEWSDLADGFRFYSGADGEPYKDVVLYNGTYYSCTGSHTKGAMRAPGSAADIAKGYWQTAANFEMVATNVLLTQYARIKNLGAEAIEMYDSSGNALFVAKDGNVTCKTGTFENVTVNGYYKSVFTKVSESDATKISNASQYTGAPVYRVTKMLNLLREYVEYSGGLYGTQDIELPTDSSYIGTRILIADNFIPKSRNDVNGRIYPSSGYILGSTDDSKDSTGGAIPVIASIDMAGGVAEFLGIPAEDGSCQWCLTGLNACHYSFVTSSDI
jgi:hypothetical protein